jgi:hypothetical protein
MYTENRQKSVVLRFVGFVVGILVLAAVIAGCWYYLRGRKTNPTPQHQLTLRPHPFNVVTAAWAKSLLSSGMSCTCPYAKRSGTSWIGKPQAAGSSMQVLFDTLSAMPPLENCPECGSIMSHLDATFLSQNGKTWNVPLRAWPKCDVAAQGAGNVFRTRHVTLRRGKPATVRLGIEAAPVASKGRFGTIFAITRPRD